VEGKKAFVGDATALRLLGGRKKGIIPGSSENIRDVGPALPRAFFHGVQGYVQEALWLFGGGRRQDIGGSGGKTPNSAEGGQFSDWYTTSEGKDGGKGGGVPG